MKNSSRAARLWLGIFFLTIATAVSALAYDIIRGPSGQPVTWNSGSVTIDVKLGSATTLQDGSTYASSVITAMQQWNSNIGAVQLNGRDVGSGNAGERNSINEMAFAADVYGDAYGENVIAVALSSRGGARQDGTYPRTESDILFNTARTWNSYRGARQGGTLDIRRVALHELGHLLGLDHPDEANQTVNAIMNSRVGDLDVLQQDDIDGGQFLYGSPTSIARPVNDAFANAIAIAVSATQVTGANRGGTKETGEPNHAPSESGGASIWWRWTAPSNGSMTLTTAGSNFDTLLGVYTGSAVASLTQVGSNDDVQSGVIRTSTLTFNVSSGVTYFIAVDGWESETGSITLNLAFTPAVVASPPVITTQPSNQSATPGGTATFNVVASGNPTGYQWSRGGTAISGATSATLTLNNVQASDAGSYTVVVTNANGSVTSNAASLTILPQGLSAQTVTTGFDVAFSAPSTSGTVRWQISTNGGTTWADLSNGSPYSGATTGTLLITGATSALANSRYRYVITTAGGTSTSNGAALTIAPAHFPMPTGIAVDGSGNLYVTDSSTHTVSRIDSTGGISALAGSSGQTGATDGSGTAARFNQPSGVAVALDGTATIGDTANGLLRRITTAGFASTLAGSATARGNADGAAGSATFGAPHGVAIDAAGAVFVADSTNHTIRRLGAGIVSTFAGSAGAAGITDGNGSAARFNDPQGVTIDSSGNLFVADAGNDTIRRISPGGAVTTFAGVGGISGFQDGTGAGALFNTPRGLTVDREGSVFVADTNNSVIRRINANGVVTTFAGLPGVSGMKDGTGTDAWFNKPRAVTIDGNGNLYVADTGNAAIRRITPNGVVTTLALSVTTTTPVTNPTPTPTPSPPSGSSGGGGGGGGGAPSGWFIAALAAVGIVRWLLAWRGAPRMRPIRHR